MSPDPRPFILVTGPMRSGTTLVAELLYSRAYRERRHSRLCFDNDEGVTVRRVLGRAPPTDGPLPDAGDIAREIISLAPGAAPEVLGAKVTHVSEGLERLRERFPKLVLVICSRDPIDIYRSHLVRTRKSPAEALAICKAINENERLIQANDDAIVLPYEAVIANPRTVIRRILARAGLNVRHYDWAALEAGRVASNSSYGPTEGKGFVLDNGVVPTSSTRRISRLERLLVEAACQRSFERLRLRMRSTVRERQALRNALSSVA